MVGVPGETTATGKPKPDVRTVARLVELGWWDTAEKAEVALTRLKMREERETRFPYETASLAIEWLVVTLGWVEHRSGRCCAAQAIHKYPDVLASTTSTLQRGWDTFVLSREDGGLGVPREVARQRVATYPQVLCITREFVMERAAFLEKFGVPDGRVAIGRKFTLLNASDDRLRKGAEWLQSQGLDLKRMMKSHSQLLQISPEQLLAKLDLLCTVAGLAKADITSPYLAYSLEGRMRPRYFYALRHIIAGRYMFGSLMAPRDEVFLKWVDELDDVASVKAVLAYRQHIASPDFCAYMDEQERAIRARRARVNV